MALLHVFTVLCCVLLATYQLEEKLVVSLVIQQTKGVLNVTVILELAHLGVSVMADLTVTHGAPVLTAYIGKILKLS